jgi:hypothetical protein
MSSYTRRAGDPPDGSWIPKDQLKEGQWYFGKCRNADYAQWKDGKFVYVRYKFGDTFLDEVECPEDDRGFDVFFAFGEMAPPK